MLAATEAERATRPRISPARRLAMVLLAVLLSFDLAALEPGEVVPDWSLDSSEGVNVDYYAATAGRPSVLLFWATWCPYCRALMPHIEAVRREYAARGIEVYALNVWEDDDPAAYLATHDLGFTLLPAADLVAEDYAIKGTPGLLVIDGQHRLVYQRQRGEEPHAVAQAMRAALEELLAPAAPTMTTEP